MNTKGKSSLKNLLLLLIAVGVGMYFLKPAWDDYSVANLKLAGLESSLEIAQQKVVNIRSGSGGAALVSEVEKVLLDKKIPGELNQPDLILKFKDFAERADLTLNSINFSNPQGNNKGSLVKATVNANLVGGFGGLLNFLKLIEESERKFTVRNITVQKGQTEGVLRVNFSLTIETYYLAG